MVSIKVLKEDIEHGKAGKCNECPIALAVMYTYNLKHRDQVNVDGSGISIYFGKFDKNVTEKYNGTTDQRCPITRRVYENYISFKTPEKAVKFITAFDNGEKVRPFTFQLPNIPEFV